MVLADRYRHYAAECVRLARRTADTAERDVLLRMAETWRRLAERAEKLDSPADGNEGPK
jgi:hypothetical protein